MGGLLDYFGLRLTQPEFGLGLMLAFAMVSCIWFYSVNCGINKHSCFVNKETIREGYQKIKFRTLNIVQMFAFRPIPTGVRSYSKAIIPRKKEPSLGGLLMRANHSWGSLLTVIVQYSAITVNKHGYAISSGRIWLPRISWSYSSISLPIRHS